MLFILGLITVVISVFFSYAMAGGNLMLLWQPAEISIIVGVGIGSILISSNKSSIKQAIISLGYLFKGNPYTKEHYLELLLFFFNATRIMKIKGLVAIENHIEHPDDSELFRISPSILRNSQILEFIRGNIRLIIMGVDQQHQLDEAIDTEIDTEYETYTVPSKLFHHFADALPALGIVAAVLGVIITMRSIAEPPEVLGALIGAALVGTFTGVLLSYGLFGPIAFFLTRFADAQVKYLECTKIGLTSYLQGTPQLLSPNLCVNLYQFTCVPLFMRLR
ncbi:MAG UNVERIFIED_CONTAM: flagellar motor stator protein MotA [Rickettsiaceae bacterium]|jgi:chemotaxis protein MotA